MKSAVMIATAVLAASSVSALANSNDYRQREQNAQIESGREGGSITWREGLKLRRQQDEIARIEANMKADGHLTRDEKRTLHTLQDNAQDRIARESSDGWRRPWWLRRFGY
ncbi:MAG: hypothetical protein ABL907_26040 [Hyphomicrobium sp.]